MRAGLSTIQQTLTPEAAAVVNRSMAEAARRSHGQTTPLHVAATLLSAPSGLLRQACVRSHPTSSHPLQCRALDLCFSVALDRLPSTTTASAAAAVEPPISNALMAALKRAQAHQRRGCPEQQQQPLLAVKVELEQLVVSILDDPSVSRVMREASFSSPAVKSTIEQTLTPSPSADRSLYMNPRLQPPPTAASASAVPAADFSEAKRVMEIMARPKKRNPVIVADSDPVAVMKEVLRRIESRDDSPPSLRAARIVSLEDELGSDRSKIGELGSAIAGRIGDRGAILDLGDLKWLVESSGGCSGSGPGQIRQQIVPDAARAAVAEIGKLLGRLCGGENRVWLVGAATCATYLRCQVYHPTMEADWDLQAVPISPRSPFPNLFPRLGCNGILSGSCESVAPIKGFQVPGSSPALQRQFPESLDLSRRTTTLCPVCVEGYQRELGKLASKESEKPESALALPRWLQLAKPDHLQSKEQELMKKQSADEMLKRWHDTCSRLHPKPRPPRAPLLSRNCNGSLESPVITELVLGHRTSPDGTPRKAHPDRINDLTGFIKNGISNKDGDRDSKSTTNLSDFDSFKKLFKGLADKVGWQPEAASSIATIMMQGKSGNGKQRGAAPKGDTWLFFSGSDVVGKRRMAAALSKLVFSAEPITVCLAGSPRADGQDEESGFSFRGKTSIDRVTEAVRRNPFSLVVLEGIDQADTFIKGSIKRAIERGRLLDSQGREVGLGSVIFVLISDWIPDELKTTQRSILECEERVLESVNCGWQLELSIDGNAGKRGADNADIVHHRPNKLRKESGGSRLSLDLNLAAGIEEDEGQQLVEGEGEGEGEEGSRNSSDLTVEHDHKSMRLAISSTTPSPSPDLIESVGDAIVFNPVDFGPLRRKTLDYISTKFATLMGNAPSIRVDEDALNRIVGGVWLDGAGATGLFEDWAEKVLFPSLQHLKRNLNSGDGAVSVRLSAVKRSKRQLTGEGWLPSTVAIAGDERGWAVEA